MKQKRLDDVFDKIDEQDSLNMLASGIEGLIKAGYGHEALRGCVLDIYVRLTKHQHRCPDCQDRPGFNGLGKMCKTCQGTAFVKV